MVVPKINSAHGSDTRNIINAAIDSINVQGKSIQDLVADGQLTPSQYAELVSIVNGNVKKGSITTFDIDKNNFAVDQTMISDSLRQMIAGDAPINAVPADDSITLKKLAFNPVLGKISKNMFNKNTITNDKYVKWDDGKIYDSPAFHASDYIPIEPNTVYTISSDGQIAFYNNQKVYISGIERAHSDNRSKTFTSPSNASYIRISVIKVNLSTYQMEKGASSTPYVKHEVLVGDNSIGSQQLKDKSISSEKYGDKSIPLSALNFAPAVMKQSKNLFNKNTVIDNMFITPGTGVPTESPSGTYVASDFIAVEPNTTYTVSTSEQRAFYDINKNTIFLQSDVDGSYPRTFTIPSNVRYIRLSVKKVDLNYFQMEKGASETDYEKYGRFIEKDNLPPEILEKINGTDSPEKNNDRQLLTDVFSELHNPFVRTNIKIIGDSNVAGVGGSGYSASGEVITGDYRSNEVGVAWSNMMRDYIHNKFNKETIVPIDHEKINIPYNLVNRNVASETGVYISLNENDSITFDFYGAFLSIYYSKKPSGGKFKVSVDNQAPVEVDTNHTVTERRQEYILSGLNVGKHTVTISGIGNTSDIEGVKVFKYAQAKNWGITGIASNWLLSQLGNLVKDDDDIVMILAGSNDRAYASNTRHTSTLRRHIYEMVKYVSSRQKKVVLLSSSPASLENEGLNRVFHKEDVDNVMQSVSDAFNMEYISVYKHILYYCDIKDIEVESLLADGVHPNDEGYRLAWWHIAKSVGLAVPIKGATW